MWPYDRGAISLAEEMWDIEASLPLLDADQDRRLQRRMLYIDKELGARAGDFIDLPLEDIQAVLAAVELVGMDKEADELHAAAASRVTGNRQFLEDMQRLEMAVA